MLLHSLYSFYTMMALAFSLSSLGSSQDTDGPFSCYQGSFQSNTRGEIKRHSERNLISQPCQEPIPLNTTQPTSTAPANTSDNSSLTSPQTTIAPVTTGKQQITSLVNWCIARRYPTSGSVSINSTWTANFSCLLATTKCPQNMFCCKKSNCNDLQFFRQHTGAKIATVKSCYVMANQNGSGPVPEHKCRSGSEYCFNQTTNDGVTSFGCSADKIQISCRNITVDNKDRCVNNGKFSLCCCANDNCNGPTSSAHPTVPTTTHYLVTASKHSSNWTLVLIIACAVLIGGIFGVVATVLYKRWRKKQNANGPLNISYSRVSADFADDDNVFSY